MNAEDQLVKELQGNEQIVQIVSYDDLVKEWEAVKPYAKQGAQFVSPVNDSVIAAKLLSEFGLKPNKVVIKQYGGKKYVIFKGYPGTRKIFRGTRYLTENPKVVRMAVGPKGVAKAVKGGFVITVVLSVGIEVFDYFIRDTATLPQLLGTVTGDIIKIGVSSIAAAAAGLAVGSAVALGSVVGLPIIAAIAVGVATGMALDYIDKKIGATAALIKAYEHMGIKLREIEYEVAWWYNFFENNPGAIMRLFGGTGSPYLYSGGY